MTESASHRRSESVVASLHRLAAAPVEAFEPRAADLEARLRSAIADDSRRAAPLFLVAVDDEERRAIRTRRIVALAGAACLAVLISVAALAAGSGTDEVVLSSTESVNVVLPDGSTIEGVDGLAVPDGALLDVSGFVVVDGRRFGPGVYRVTDDGRIVEIVDVADVVEPVEGPDPGVEGDSGTPTGPAGDDDVDSGRDGAVVTDGATTTTVTSTVAAPTTTVRSRPPRSTVADQPTSTVPPPTRPPPTRPPPTVTRPTDAVAVPPRSAPDVPTTITTSIATTTTTTTTSTTTTVAARRGAVPENGRGGTDG